MSRIKQPTRPSNEITQQFNDGVVQIYTLTDSVTDGMQPVPTGTLRLTLRYEEQRLGINRLYLAKQNQVEIERVIRVPRLPISNQDGAVTEDGTQYGIESVQSVDGVYPPSVDVALKRITQNFNVNGGEPP